MKKQSIIFFMLFATTILASCSKGSTSDNANNGSTTAALPQVTTNAVVSVTASTAVISGTLTALNEPNATTITRGVCWDTSHNPTLTTPYTTQYTKSGAGSFTFTLDELSGGVTYYARTYATNSTGTTYGSEVSFTTPAPAIAIGNYYSGGVIFYIDNTKTHGLVAAPTYTMGSQPWDNGSYINSTMFVSGTAVGTGSANTTKILNVMGTTKFTAALWCRKIAVNGYSDWYLPSKDEMNLLKVNVMNADKAHYAVNLSTYWTSSTDYAISYYAIQQNAINDNTTIATMSSTANVQAIRSF